MKSEIVTFLCAILGMISMLSQVEPLCGATLVGIAIGRAFR